LSGPARLCLVALVLGSTPAGAGTLLLSANDGLQRFADGAYVMRAHPGPGTLSAFDLDGEAPRPLWQVPIAQTAVGPPTAIAVTPDGRLALLANPASLDPADPGKVMRGQDLQVVPLAGSAPAVGHVALGHHPWSVAVAPDGRLAATANGDGTLTLLRIGGAEVTVLRDVPVGSANSLDTGVAFSKDGHFLLASLRHDDVVTLFRVEGETLEAVRDITVGSNPYEIVTSPDGRFAAVSNIGRNSGDHDSISLIDLAAEPVRTVGVFPVAPTPEGLAFSPDSRFLAVNSINGSNLKAGNPFRSDHSLIQLFALDGSVPHLVGTAEVGPNAQGLAFADGGRLIVQDYASDALLLFSASNQGLRRLEPPVPVEGGPAAVAVVFLPSGPKRQGEGSGP
jgi:DNA-binding beta-propeller fold protein YncE